LRQPLAADQERYLQQARQFSSSGHEADKQSKGQHAQIPFNERPYMLVDDSMAFGNSYESYYTPLINWEVTMAWNQSIKVIGSIDRIGE